MNAAGRLAAFGVGLAVAFVTAYTTAAAVVPAPAATPTITSATPPPAAASAPAGGPAAPAAAPPADPAGLSLARGGYQLSPVQAPNSIGAPGELRFSILDPAGRPLVDYDTVHDKLLHLIVVRSDGTQFSHVHPSLDRRTGAWSIPFEWKAAGTYRIFADFTPTGGRQLTLTRAVDVAGAFTPSRIQGSRTIDRVDGYTVELQGDLIAGAPTELTARITRGDRPVTSLQPYLGAFGHLVALRDGDLAYLHVHPEGDEPAPRDSGGPAVAFAATAPTAGRYLLYLDFQVEGTVRTATFVLDATRAADRGTAPTPAPAHDTGHGGH
ncbi:MULTISPECIES: hypothetical protein [Mycolicibacterium]|uniref:Heavy metal-binding domain-containing protein n=1 Tax=Mycolicibacterium bacteremicum TaxID=564198 RepID=A0A1W9Z3V8_MYCBA|nr:MULTISPECIES: hypothetical protein [Mycolicibacterium]MCV7432635.1 hypothetical protein [Mycolicibacterium bacteremicum]ORA06937.1 hypothetical protein BST17_00200 [Mycolicibacterium bacteremicum]QVI28277.1 hypothetical protein MN2019_02510 [Mycolicibacterium neoaurum]